MKIFLKGSGMTVTYFRKFLMLGCMKTVFIPFSSMQIYIFITLFLWEIMSYIYKIKMFQNYMKQLFEG